MKLREAEPSDAESITCELWLPLAREMEKLSADNKLSKDLDIDRCVQYREEKLYDEDSFTVLAEDEDMAVGFITVTVKEEPPVFQKDIYAKINELYIKESYRRKGLASQLLDRILKEAKDRGCETLELNVNVKNKAAEQLYLGKGFRPEQTRMIKQL